MPFAQITLRRKEKAPKLRRNVLNCVFHNFKVKDKISEQL
jgi:hypothetical protein